MRDRVLQRVDEAADELVELTAELVRMPTVNPPGEGYRECAEAIGRRLQAFGFAVDYVEADGRPEHSDAYPRVNVLGVRRGESERPLVHLNGHFDVVPAGDGWTADPFGGEVRDGRVYGRGSADMKGGLAAAIFAAEALRRADVPLAGSIEVSGTVDEESGGLAGVAYLAESGRLSSDRVDHAIIPEPLDVDRICIGHRGVYWFKVTATGRIAHGSMPFSGISAIDHVATLVERVRTGLVPELARRKTAMPVVPPEARQSTINVNSILGGQAGEASQTPCVADRCEAIFDRRFLIEEGFEETRSEVERLLAELSAEDESRRYELEDLLIVHPTRTPAGSPLVASLEAAIGEVLGRSATRVASPGTYDQKHFSRIGHVHDCVAYGPGVLEQAHQPDEWVAIDDLVSSAKVMALTLLDLVGPRT